MMATKNASTSNDIEVVRREVELLQKACQFLGQCQDVTEVKKLRDKAEALRLYTKQRADSQDAQNAAAVIKIRAELRIGELAKAMEKNVGGRPTKNHSLGASGFQTLKDLGIGKDMSARCQSLTYIPPKEFEKRIENALKHKRELTSREMQKLGRHHKIDQEKKADIAERVAWAKKCLTAPTPEEIAERGAIWAAQRQAAIERAEQEKERAEQAILDFEISKKRLSKSENIQQYFDTIMEMHEIYAVLCRAPGHQDEKDRQSAILSDRSLCVLTSLCIPEQWEDLNQSRHTVIVSNNNAYIYFAATGERDSGWWEKVPLVNLDDKETREKIPIEW
jgi:hypothetical protein